MSEHKQAPTEANRKNVTMKDVALQAGVHHSSVSVVLNGSRSSAGISAATRQRILDVAAELGYRRNVSAHIIRTGRFGSVALLLSPKRSSSYLPPSLLGGLHDALTQADMTLTMCLLPDEELTEGGALPKILRERMCDGLLIDYNLQIPDAMIETIQRHEIPSVWINSKQPSDCAYPDDFDAGVQATRHLIHLGHTRIVYADFIASRTDHPTQHYSRRERRDGYLAAMQAAGLEPLLWGTDQFVVDSSQQIDFCQKLLCAPQRPTAIVSYAIWAIEGLSYAAMRLGLKVPDDLSVVSFGPEQIDYMCRPMTMVIEPQYQLALTATRMILEKIENPTSPLAPTSVPFSLQEGYSTTALPGATVLRPRSAPSFSQTGAGFGTEETRAFEAPPLVQENASPVEAFPRGALAAESRENSETLPPLLFD